MPQESSPSWEVIVAAALEAAKVSDWKRCQELCALTAERRSPALMTVSRFNILICQYQLGFTNLIPERALPLIEHLPPDAVLATLGLSLLAARKNGTLQDYKRVVLALADAGKEALELPSVPIFVLLHEDEIRCTVHEFSDASLMSEIVSSFLAMNSLNSDSRTKLESLAQRYRERADITANNLLESKASKPGRSQ